MKPLRLVLPFLVATFLAAHPLAASGPDETPGNATVLFNQGDFRAAAAAFQKIIDQAPSPEAYAGLVQSLLKLDDVDAAEDQARKGLEKFPQSAVALAADGDVKFRRGLMAEAEDQYGSALKRDEKCARAWLGMARIDAAASLPQRAKEALSKAHELARQDGDTLYYWAIAQPYPQNVSGLEKHLAEFRNDAEWERHEREFVDFLKALAGRKVWLPAREVQRAEIKLQPIFTPQQAAPQGNGTRAPVQSIIDNPETRVRGYSLQVKLNDRATGTVMLDTGASGLTISRKLAEKAGAKKLSDHSLEGVGNEAPLKGYEAWVDKVTIGELEFHDCHVHVTPRNNPDFDGLIGTNVFEDYLVKVDLPARKLLMEPLPELIETASGKAPARKSSFTQFYRFGHILLMPTTVGTSARGLFLLDTGSATNSISPQLARRVSRVRGSNVAVHGMSGNVKDVYTADEAVLQFSRFSQLHQDMVTFDVHAISKDLGTEVSGFIGFPTLRNMKMIIDYRDGLVDFEYKP
jgi:tetratricopeptide (TPR) repeat protein